MIRVPAINLIIVYALISLPNISSAADFCSDSFLNAMRTYMEVSTDTSQEIVTRQAVCDTNKGGGGASFPIPVPKFNSTIDIDGYTSSQVCRTNISVNSSEFHETIALSYLPDQAFTAISGCQINTFNLILKEVSGNSLEIWLTYSGYDASGNVNGTIEKFTPENLACKDKRTDSPPEEGKTIISLAPTILDCKFNEDSFDRAGQVAKLTVVLADNKGIQSISVPAIREEELNWKLVRVDDRGQPIGRVPYTADSSFKYMCALDMDEEDISKTNLDLLVGEMSTCTGERPCYNPESMNGHCSINYGSKITIKADTEYEVERINWRPDYDTSITTGLVIVSCIDPSNADNKHEYSFDVTQAAGWKPWMAQGLCAFHAE